MQLFAGERVSVIIFMQSTTRIIQLIQTPLLMNFAWDKDGHDSQKYRGSVNKGHLGQ